MQSVYLKKKKKKWVSLFMQNKVYSKPTKEKYISINNRDIVRVNLNTWEPSLIIITTLHQK
jgi:hypothetical protein